MSSNRYTNLSFSSLRDTPLLQLPYEQLDQMLASQQGQMNISKQLQQKSPNYIQESKFATNAAKQISDYQLGIKNKLREIAATGNTREYMSALAEANNRLANLYRPGGMGYNLEQDFKTYQAHVAKEQERLAKGEIDQYQYQQSISEPLSQYDTFAGEKRYSPTLKPEAVNFDDFADKFVKNYKDTDLINRGGFRVVNGRMVYDDQKVTGVEAQKVLNDLTQAYANAAGNTGQLQDRFRILNKDGQITANYRSTQEKNAASMLRLLNTDLTDKDKVKELQRKLNALGLDVGKVDGVAGPKTKAAMEIAKNAATTTIDNLNTQDDAQITKDAEQAFYQDYISSLARPYASATGRQKENRKFTNFGETLQRVKEEADIKTKADADQQTLIVRTLPANKAVPQNIEYYVKGDEIRKNTNASADLKSKLADAPWNIFNIPGYYRTAAFLDRLFTKNDKVDVDSSPELSNIKDHLIAANPTLANESEEVQMKAIVDEINRQGKGSIDARYTAGNTKFKKGFDTTFAPVLDKDGKILNVGNLVNFKFQNRNGNIISGQQFAKQATDDGLTISYKGAVTDVASDIQYGSTVLAVGNDEIYMEPDIQTTYDPNTLISGAYRAMNNAEVGNVSNFKYRGHDFSMMFKPDGSFQATDKNTKETQILYPVVQDGQLVGLSPTKSN